MGKAIAGGVLLILVGVGLVVAAMMPAMQCNVDTGSCGQVNGALLGTGIVASIAGGLVATIVPVVMVFSGMARGAALQSRLRQTGVPGTARIVSVAETGLTVNDAPQVDMVLEVAIAGRPPYQVRHRELVPRLALGRLTDGRPLQVMVDPMQPEQLVVNWLAQPAPTF
jgi:hypothetical protein